VARSAVHPCAGGCGALVPGSVARCETCERERVSANRRAKAPRDRASKAGKPWRRAYTDPRWRALAKRTLREEPICRRCTLRRSEVADHVIPIGSPFWGEPFERANTQGLCRPCHTTKTKEDERAASAQIGGRR
jgi:5-methylcytosine-specific restriction endonuclease McrA